MIPVILWSSLPLPGEASTRLPGRPRFSAAWSRVSPSDLSLRAPFPGAKPWAFHDHVLLASGVSGGSVGLMSYLLEYTRTSPSTLTILPPPPIA